MTVRFSNTHLLYLPFLIFLLHLLSNIPLYFLNEKFLEEKIAPALFLADVFFISLIFYFTQGFESDLFVIYFLLIFMTAIGKNPSAAFLTAGMACLLYALFYLKGNSFSDLFQPAILLRFSMLIVVACFSSVILQGFEKEREKIKSEKEEAEKNYRQSLEKYLAEERHLREQLLQSQKMEAVGRLAGGIAHDFNNLLTVIIGYVHFCLSDLKDKGAPNPQLSPFEQHALCVKKAAEHATSLTKQLLAFSRRQIISPKAISLNDVVENMSQMLKRIIGEDIEYTAHLDPELGAIVADPSQIEQVLLNLVVNARDAMPYGGKLVISTNNVDLDENYASTHLETTPGAYIQLAVSDTGTGMSKEVQARIFEPFFTTKEMGKGTGLGLSTVYGIVKQHRGEIQVYSEPGRGTTFKIMFPKADVKIFSRKSEEMKKPPLLGKETILVVEDEETVLTVIQKILNKYGYKVVSAKNGVEALAVFQQRREEIDLVLTDTVMPQMNGEELSQQLKKMAPEQKIIFMSGYADGIITQNGLLKFGKEFIEKPFTPEKLTSKIREVLDKERERKEESLAGLQWA